MSLTALYRCILDDVIKNVKPEFDAEGLEDTVLHDLQQIWEERLQSATTVFNQEPYFGQQQYDTTGTYSSYSADSQHQYPNMQHNDIYYQGQVQQGYAQPSARYTPAPTATSSSSSATSSTHTTQLAEYDHIGRPQQYMPPPRSWSHEPNSITVINDNTHSRGTIPQRDGTCDDTDDSLAPVATSTTTLSEASLAPQQQQQQQTQEATDLAQWNRAKQEFISRMQRNIPQFDGIVDGDGNDDGNDDDADDGNHHDDDDDGDDKPAANKDDDEELNSDLDDDDEVPESDHLVLCQFEKVIRIKNKRKCNLKDGVMRLNGRDYLFSKANGEFEF